MAIRGRSFSLMLLVFVLAVQRVHQVCGGARNLLLVCGVYDLDSAVLLFRDVFGLLEEWGRILAGCLLVFFPLLL